MTKRPSPARARKRALPKAGLRLDLACGTQTADGFVGVDIAGTPDVTHDLLETPWPFADGSVAEARCSHFVEHIPHHRPGWDRDGWWRFFDELYRVCEPDAKVELVHPYGRSDRAWWDPTHERAIMDQTWYYLDRVWREANHLDHYPVVADFEVVVINAIGVPDAVMSRNDDYQQFARQFYSNVYADLHVILKARKP